MAAKKSLVRGPAVVCVSVGLLASSVLPALAATPTPTTLQLNAADSWQAVPTFEAQCLLGDNCGVWAWRNAGSLGDVAVLNSGYAQGKKAAKARYRELADGIAATFDPNSDVAPNVTVTASKATDKYRKSGKKRKSKISTRYLTNGNIHVQVSTVKAFRYDKDGQKKKRVGIAMIYLSQTDVALPDGLQRASGALLQKQSRKLIKSGKNYALTGPVRGLSFT